MAVKLNYSHLFYFLGFCRLTDLWKRKSSKVKQAPAVNWPCRKEKGLTSVGRRHPAQIPEGVLFSWDCHCPLPLTQVTRKESAFKGLHQLWVSVSLGCYIFVKSSIILIKYEALIFIYFSLLLSGGFGLFGRKDVLMWRSLIFGSRREWQE